MAGKKQTSIPKNQDGSYDKELVKEWYMDSKHVDWTSFSKSMGWDSRRTAQYFPTRSWIRSKKRAMAKAHAKELENLSFDHIYLWKKDVLRTMRDYPEAIDTMKNIALAKMNDMIKQANDTTVDKNGKTGLQRLKTGDIMNMSVSLAKLQEAKHKALLLNELSIKQAEEPVDVTNSVKGSGKSDGNQGSGWQIGVIGYGDKIDPKQLEEMMAEYFDNYEPGQLQAPDQGGLPDQAPNQESSGDEN